MARRSLSKFISYFQIEFEGVEFPFVNKVGENSQPNGYPLWFGKSIESGRTVEWEELKADWNYTEHCERYLDNYTNIFNEFKEHGYVTALLEDWKDTMVDSWPFCKGFQKSPTDHTFRPFASVVGEYGTNMTRKHLDGHHCREIHHALFEYLEQLFGAYKDRPLFSWTWLSKITHSYIDGVARIDEFLIEFFKRNHETFENSFVFFVSDHGLRFGYGLGDYLKTEIGSFERHNPYLAISIPKNLRSKSRDILRTLRENSLQLQTHYDTRATLLDILKFQPMAEFKNRHPIKINGEKGNSLIRRQPSSPRTCATLPIPLQYCICQVAKWETRNKPLQKYLGPRLVDHVNTLLSKSNMSEICETHQMEKVTSLTEFGYSKQFKTYKMSVQTNYAHFEAMMMFDQKKDETKFTKVVRLDAYGDTVNCTEKIRHEPLCHCKKENN
ncbi:hypothetical protein CAEBREN_11083 [Caenorhabditis brenneri]|uniref:Sulfatase N-terminal domain-containing protein n=1 Tax=Caenorhabditis brenneri TaxID=135651 RepID=G0MJJ5_CAEBE|nr:hypothetical protein CAEBREN_11083 [Caenorhabditis brenneri]